jgi:hypothetical protein
MQFGPIELTETKSPSVVKAKTAIDGVYDVGHLRTGLEPFVFDHRLRANCLHTCKH